VILRMLHVSAGMNVNALERLSMNQQRKVRLIAVIVANIILSVDECSGAVPPPKRRARHW
jgi:hypothetical protein